MKKLFAVALCATFFGTAAAASAGFHYESYDGYQYVGENNQFNFLFNLTDSNPTMSTSSSLALMQDARSGAQTFETVFMDISLYSVDWSFEKMNITLKSYSDNSLYTLYDGWFNGGFLANTTQTFHFDLTGTSFLNDPYGQLTIKASGTPFFHYNDFAITKVAMGGTTAPVPEPGTLLLFGAGLTGLAAIGRRKIQK